MGERKITKSATANPTNGTASASLGYGLPWTSADTLLVALIVLLLAIVLAPTLGSGFHLTDDHEIIELNSRLNKPNASVIGVAREAVERDMFRTHRLRPLYYILRVGEVSMLGTNFSGFSIVTFLLALGAALALYFAGRLSGFSPLQGGVFVALSLAGLQAVIWWELGPAETVGTFLLAFALFFCFLAVRLDTKRWPDVAFFLTSSLAALTKESFILVIPGLVFLRLWFDSSETWKGAIRKNRTLILAMSMVFIGEMLLLKIIVGFGGVGYAGVDSGTWNPVAWGRVLLQMRLLFISTVAVISLTLVSRRYGYRYGHSFFAASIALILWLAPQVLLYAKSGMGSRYLVPSSIGIAFFTVFIWASMMQNEREHLLRTGKFSRIVTYGLAITICISFLGTFWLSLRFGFEGRALNQMFADVQRETRDRDRILIVADPAKNFEWSFSIKRYLSTMMGRDNLYLFPVFSNNYSDFETALAKQVLSDTNFYKGKTVEGTSRDGQRFTAVLVFEGLEDTFLARSKNWFNPKSFVRKQYQQTLTIGDRGVQGKRFVAYYR